MVGFRSWQKALLTALCLPNEKLKRLQDESRLTELMVMQEAMKTAPFGDVWDEYLRQCGVEGEPQWFETVKTYEADVLAQRN